MAALSELMVQFAPWIMNIVSGIVGYGVITLRNELKDLNKNVIEMNKEQALMGKDHSFTGQVIDDLRTKIDLLEKALDNTNANQQGIRNELVFQRGREHDIINVVGVLHTLAYEKYGWPLSSSTPKIRTRQEINS